MENIKISYFALFQSLLIGGFLSGLYLFLLWYSVKIIQKINKPGLFLLLSALFRIIVVISLAIYLAQDNVGKFLEIVAGFIITRLIVVSLIKVERRHLHD